MSANEQVSMQAAAAAAAAAEEVRSHDGKASGRI